jgi:hypothetical protein
MYGVYEGDFPRTVLLKYNGQLNETTYEWFMSNDAAVLRERLTHASKIVGPGLGNSLDVADNWWFEWDNPRIRLDDGSTIWGDECWWALIDKDDPPLKDLEKAQEETVEAIKALAQILTETKGEVKDE